MKKLKEGDSCYFQFTLGTAHEVINDRITTFRGKSGGMTSAMDLTDHCFPVNDKTKEIAELVRASYDKINECNMNGLNFPAIHSRLCKWFDEMCAVQDNKVALEVLADKVVDFTNDVVDSIRVIRGIQVDGIKIIR